MVSTVVSVEVANRVSNGVAMESRYNQNGWNGIWVRDQFRVLFI